MFRWFKFSLSAVSDMEGPVVNTPCGQLLGTIKKSVEGFDYAAFKGIPYAKPPVGELRFADPVPVEPWTGVKEAIKCGSLSGQCNVITNVIEGSDDCLYLNVYVKSIDPNARLPVMVWIHGGGFTIGSGDVLFYGPDYLLRKDIVLVTINYRLGILGFLNLEDEVAPGNQGLKDQVLALKWVQSNIESFGGDPNNVTIFGESAGGASVHYLCISPLAKGLFHKAISQSGVALNCWASMPENPKKYALEVCSLLGKELHDSKKIVEFLRTVDCHKLIEMQQKVKSLQNKLQHVYSFGPGVDRKSSNPFLPVPVAVTAQEGVDVPYLLGYNSREGIYFLLASKMEDIKKLNDSFEEYLHPHILDILRENNLTPTDLQQIYFGDEEISEKNIGRYVDLCSDMHFIVGIHEVIKYQVQKSSTPTYVYQFTYDQGFSFIKALTGSTLEGVSHTDEVAYLFKTSLVENIVNISKNVSTLTLLNMGCKAVKSLPAVFPLNRSTTTHRIMEQMTEMWVNFATTGRPTPVTSELIPVDWRPVINDFSLHYLNIGENLCMENTHYFNLHSRSEKKASET